MDGEAAPRWTENRPTRGLRAVRLHELWEYRELAFFLALRDVKARYKQAAFGIAWAIMQPVAGVVLLTLVFREVAGVDSEGIPYPLFALVGYLAWTYFASTVTAATVSLVANSALVTKTYFPRLAAPASALLPGLVNLAPGLLVLGALIVYYGDAPGAALLALPLCMLGMMVAALGVGLLLTTLNVKYRDVGSVIGTLLQLWLLASPVAYPTSLVPEAWRLLYSANPMVGVIESFRWSVLGGSLPVAEVLVSAASAAGLLMAGLVYFASAERRFADLI